jgi:hypothetical protein
MHNFFQRFNIKTSAFISIVLISLLIINFGQKGLKRQDTLNIKNTGSRTSSYNDKKIRYLESKELANKNDKSRFYLKRNFFHPNKVKIISNTWNLCTSENGADLDLFVFLWTRVSSFKLRETIRRTWASRTSFPNINVGFILGLSSNPVDNMNVAKEIESYGDIIQGDFIDSYKNISFKSLVSWRWVKYNCMNVKYLVKMDDDVFLNTPILLDHIRSEFEKKPPVPYSFFCSIWSGSVAIRDRINKFYVSEEEWPQPAYPYYCSGVAYLFTYQLMVALYNASYSTRDFWIGKSI